MREIETLDFEVWWTSNVPGCKGRRIAAFHFRYDAEYFINEQNALPIKGTYFLKVVDESNFYPNEIF